MGKLIITRFILVFVFLLCALLLFDTNLPMYQPDYGANIVFSGQDVSNVNLVAEGNNISDYSQEYTLILDNTGYIGSKPSGNPETMVQIDYISANEVNLSSIPDNYDAILYKSYSFQLFLSTQSLTEFSFTGKGQFLLKSAVPFSYVLILTKDLNSFRKGYYDWSNSLANPRSKVGHLLKTYTVIGLIFSIGLFAYYDTRIVKSLTLQFLTKSISAFVPSSNLIDSSQYLEPSSIELLPCCIQTARLQENYCPCGRAIPRGLLLIYQQTN